MSLWLTPFSDQTSGKYLEGVQTVAPLLVVLLLAFMASTIGVLTFEFTTLFGLGLVAGWYIAHPRGSLVPAVLVAFVLLGLVVPEWALGLFCVPLTLALLANSTGVTAQKTITEVLERKSKLRTGLDLVPKRIRGTTVEHRPQGAQGFGQQRDTGGNCDDEDHHAGNGDQNQNGGHHEAKNFTWNEIFTKFQQLKTEFYKIKNDKGKGIGIGSET